MAPTVVYNFNDGVYAIDSYKHPNGRSIGDKNILVWMVSFSHLSFRGLLIPTMTGHIIGEISYNGSRTVFCVYENGDQRVHF